MATAGRAAFAAGLASSIPLCVYLSDSRSSIYKHALKVGHYLTARDVEAAHHMAVIAMRYGLAPLDWVGNDKSLNTKVWGANFPNPIGIAAGFDKNAEGIGALGCRGLGFGFVEIGSVTPVPQPGNPLPRLFRLSKDLAIINRFGFNSDGVDAVAQRLEKYRKDQKQSSVTSSGSSETLVGVNLGKNKDTKDALSDYVIGVRKLAKYADYLVINVSSPNTVGLRSLQGKAQLNALVSGVQKELKAVTSDPEYQSMSSSSSEKYTPPLLVKISPDMTDTEMADVADVIKKLKVDGIVVSNTTIGDREILLDQEQAKETGGLSGKPLLARSNRVLSRMYTLTNGQVPIIGVGGVFTAEDAYEKIKLGASVVQLYSSLIYEGPGLPATMKEDLVKLLKADGYSSVQEAVGAAHR